MTGTEVPHRVGGPRGCARQWPTHEAHSSTVLGSSLATTLPAVKGPDFIIGGAPRSGTTSLFRWLAAHPAVSMPERKEIRFFDSNYEKGVAWYLRQLPQPDAGLVGEASPRYFAHPDAARRIGCSFPKARMVFVLRDPVERAYSDYLMDRARGRAGGTFEETLGDADHWSRYVETGYYATHLRRFYAAFSAEQVAVVLLDDLVDDPEGAFARVCRFLGVEAEGNEEVGRRVNPQVGFRSLAIRRLTQALPGPADRVVSRLNTRKARDAPMPDHVEGRLRETFAPHNAALAELLARPVPWPA